MDWRIVNYQTVDSTNLEARRMIQQQMATPSERTLHGTVLVAETQTSGKGRLGRQWVSKAATGLWFTVILKPILPMEQASFYSFAVAVSVAEAMRKQYDLPVTLKWPNDVLLDGRKLCGIMLELVPCGQKEYYLILGIGVNCNQSLLDFPQELQEKATSLAMALGSNVDLSVLLKAILERLEKNCRLLEIEGFAPIRSQWKTLNCMIGREVMVQEQGKNTYSGIVDDIAMDGTLLVRTKDGICAITAGDISLRSIDGGYAF